MDRHEDLFAAALNAIETLGDKKTGTSSAQSSAPEAAAMPDGTNAPAAVQARPAIQPVSQARPVVQPAAVQAKPVVQPAAPRPAVQPAAVQGRPAGQPAASQLAQPAASAPADAAEHKGLFGSKFGFSHGNPKDPMSILGNLLAGGRKIVGGGKAAETPAPESVRPAKPVRPAQVMDISMPADWDGKKPVSAPSEEPAASGLMAETLKKRELSGGPLRMSDIISQRMHEAEAAEAEADVIADGASGECVEPSEDAGDASAVVADVPAGGDLAVEPVAESVPEVAAPVMPEEPSRPVRRNFSAAAQAIERPVASNDVATPMSAPVAMEKPAAEEAQQPQVASGDMAQQISALQAEYRMKCKAKLLEMKSFYEAQLNDVCAQLDEMTERANASWQNAEQLGQENAALRQENAQLRAHAAALSDKLGRVSSEFDNYRKRVARDQEQFKKQAEERIISGFLPVMDNLERALAHARQASDYNQLLQGVELTGKMYLAALGKYGCVPFDSLGEVCDPNYHDVLQRVIDPDVAHNTVVQEHLKGYLMHDRVLRPALVVVAQHEGEEGGE